MYAVPLGSRCSSQLTEVSRSDVLPIESIPPDELAVLEAQTRSLYFNTRLAVIARPEYLISGDGLARTFDEVERVTVDHWNIFSNLLQEVRRTTSIRFSSYTHVLLCGAGGAAGSQHPQVPDDDVFDTKETTFS